MAPPLSPSGVHRPASAIHVHPAARAMDPTIDPKVWNRTVDQEVKMTFEIGHLTFQPAAAAPIAPVRPSVPPAAAPAPGVAEPEPVFGVDASDVIPASPPPEVLAEVDAAWERAAELAAQNRELHFKRDEVSGRTIIEVRTLDGDVLRTIPPSKFLDVLSGGEL